MSEPKKIYLSYFMVLYGKFFTVCFKVPLISIILFFNFTAVSSPCKRGFKTASRGNAIIDFVREQSGRDWEKEMPLSWRVKVIKNTKDWSSQDLDNLLNFLRRRIGTKATLSLLKTISYFEILGYGSFVEQVAVFERYIGEEGVTNHLRNSLLSGFSRKSVKEVDRNIKYIEFYIGRKALEEMMTMDISIFSHLDLNKFKEVVSLIKKYVEREGTVEIMKKEIKLLANADPGELNAVVSFLEPYVGRQLIKESMKTNIHFFLLARFIELKRVVKLKEDSMGTEAVANKMRQDISGFFKDNVSALFQIQ